MGAGSVTLKQLGGTEGRGSVQSTHRCASPGGCDVCDAAGAAAAPQQLRAPRGPLLAAAAYEQDAATGQRNSLQRVPCNQPCCLQLRPPHIGHVQQPNVIKKSPGCGVSTAVKQRFAVSHSNKCSA